MTPELRILQAKTWLACLFSAVVLAIFGTFAFGRALGVSDSRSLIASQDTLPHLIEHGRAPSFDQPMLPQGQLPGNFGLRPMPNWPVPDNKVGYIWIAAAKPAFAAERLKIPGLRP
jgi:hypothetical protein